MNKTRYLRYPRYRRYVRYRKASYVSPPDPAYPQAPPVPESLYTLHLGEWFNIENVLRVVSNLPYVSIADLLNGVFKITGVAVGVCYVEYYDVPTGLTKTFTVEVLA